MTLPAYHDILFDYHNTGYRSWAGNVWGMTRALPRIPVGQIYMSFRANVRMGSCARVYLLAQKRMRGSSREDSSCSIIVRSFHDYGRI